MKHTLSLLMLFVVSYTTYASNEDTSVIVYGSVQNSELILGTCTECLLGNCCDKDPLLISFHDPLLEETENTILGGGSCEV
ncbi:MAG: hypothetical protein Tsb002_38500 [Wenzhouxiangellaceae bacterium]